MIIHSFIAWIHIAPF